MTAKWSEVVSGAPRRWNPTTGRVEGNIAMQAVANATHANVDLATAVATRAEKILRESTYPALWNLRCQQTDGALILRGRVPLFYLKQLAQVLVAKAVDGPILNEIEVVDPNAATIAL
jgi:hypothetical protein